MSSIAQPNPSVLNRINAYLGLIRFSHTIFALPFALLATIWAYLVPLPAAQGENAEYLSFRFRDVVGILVYMVAARSFAMAINRLLDHKWDGQNPRTSKRHLPAGLLTRKEVWIFSALCGLAFVFSTFIFWPNILPTVLSIPVLAFLAGYSLTKRFTQLAHFWLGVALMLAPICVWIALRGGLFWSSPIDLLPALWLGCIVLFWVAGFDIIYACQDSEFDQGVGLYSLPARLGVQRALMVAKISHALMWTLAMAMTFAIPELSLGWIFRAAILVVGLLLWYEHSIVSDRSLERVNIAFFQMNAVISVVFLTVGSLDTWLR